MDAGKTADLQNEGQHLEETGALVCLTLLQPPSLPHSHPPTPTPRPVAGAADRNTEASVKKFAWLWGGFMHARVCTYIGHSLFNPLIRVMLLQWFTEYLITFHFPTEVTDYIGSHV